MCQSIRFGFASLAAAGLVVCLLSAPASGVTIVDDHFDDEQVIPNNFLSAVAAININPNGIGTGFNALLTGNGNYSETGSNVILRNEADGGHRTSIASKEGATLASGAATFLFDGVKFSEDPIGNPGGNTDRLFMGVADSSTAGDFQGNPPNGFFVQIESDSLLTGGNGSFSGTSQLFYESTTNVRTQLASWTFDTLSFDENAINFSPTLDLSITLDATGYSLSISGDTISNLTGSLSGAYAGAGITNELLVGHAIAFSQNELAGPAFLCIDTAIDRIVITQVPEPSSMLLLTLGAALLVRWRTAFLGGAKPRRRPVDE